MPVTLNSTSGINTPGLQVTSNTTIDGNVTISPSSNIIAKDTALTISSNTDKNAFLLYAANSGYITPVGTARPKFVFDKTFSTSVAGENVDLVTNLPSDHRKLTGFLRFYTGASTGTALMRINAGAGYITSGYTSRITSDVNEFTGTTGFAIDPSVAVGTHYTSFYKIVLNRTASTTFTYVLDGCVFVEGEGTTGRIYSFVATLPGTSIASSLGLVVSGGLVSSGVSRVFYE